MLETGIVLAAAFAVGLVVRAADRWGDRETYTAQTWAAAQARQAADKQRKRVETRHVKETV